MRNQSLTLQLLVLLGLLFAAACTEQEFDDPNASTADGATFQTLATGIEAGSRVDKQIYLQTVLILGRECYYFEPSDPRYTTELMTGPIDSNGFLLTRPWSARYRTLQNCRIMLQRAAELSAGAQRNGIEGFANTWAAHELLMNLNYTDSNGLKVDLSRDDLGPLVGRTESLAKIAAYLDAGAQQLAAAGASFSFRLTSGLAGFDTPATFRQFNRGLRARVAAYQGDFAAVQTALGESFLSTSLDKNAGVYHVYSTGSGDLLNPLYETPTADFVKLLAHPSFETAAEAGDQRFASKVVKRSAESVMRDLHSDLGVTIASSNTAPFPIIRNEELVLLRAEARIQLNQLESAAADLNLVRQWAGLGPVSLTSKEQALTQLLHERRYSLFAEGHRWVDMRRYDRLAELPVDRPNDNIIPRMPLPAQER